MWKQKTGLVGRDPLLMCGCACEATSKGQKERKRLRRGSMSSWNEAPGQGDS